MLVNYNFLGIREYVRKELFSWKKIENQIWMNSVVPQENKTFWIK
jgi:hypothetical protein